MSKFKLNLHDIFNRRHRLDKNCDPFARLSVRFNQ